MRRTPAALLLLAVLAFPLVFARPFPRHVMIMIFLYGALATAWNILAGYCGQISLGHAVYFGIGAYTSTFLVREAALTPWLGMLVGAALAVVVSQAIGYPVFRLRGHYFAIATIGFGEIVQTLVLNWDLVGGARGLFVPIKRPDSLLNLQFHDSKAVYYYLALGLLALALGATRWIERSRRGYYFRAIREDQDAAASLGVRVAREKHAAMAVSAALTALGGTFWAQYVLFIDPESVFPLSLSILICLVAVMGGVGSLWGPLLGAVVLVPLSEGTRVLLGGTGKALDLLIYGALIMAIAVFQPAGLMGLMRQLRRRRAVAPSGEVRQESAA
ncbi:MAG TPA: branched-chain amino acid ABC transporter permease [Methylomirabilota bacterium]|nr:branched-chain amino acid ABC transporter permease [Methylomirabilota bacterium]